MQQSSYQEFGPEFEEWRRRRRMSLAELARRAGLSMATVHKAELGYAISPVTAAKLYQVFREEGVRREQDVFGSKPVVRTVEYESVFISYGGPDEPFAKLLDGRLRADGVRTFFFARDAVPGARLHRTMADGVHEFDRVLLICSESSLNRTGVLNELEHVLVREADEGGTEILLPVTLDNYVFDSWNPSRADIARQVRARVILSFSGATSGGPEFDERYRRLVKALEVERLSR